MRALLHALAVGAFAAFSALGCGRIGYDLLTELDASVVARDARPGDGQSSDGARDGGDLGRDGAVADSSTADGGPRDAAAVDGAVGGQVCEIVSCPVGQNFSGGASGSLGGARNTTDLPATMGSCGGLSDQAYVVRFTATADLTLTATVTSGDFDPVMYIRDGDCCGAELACDDNSGGGTSAEATIPMLDGEAVFIIVDGANPGDQGVFSIVLSRTGP